MPHLFLGSFSWNSLRANQDYPVGIHFDIPLMGLIVDARMRQKRATAAVVTNAKAL